MSSLNLKPKYFFGEKSIFEAKDDLKAKRYQRALILYGGGSIKTNGSYDDLVSLLKSIDLPYVEFGGIEPNPKDKTLDQAISFGVENQVDVIFAIGGGSVVDASKVIGTLIANPNIYKNCWEYVLDNTKATKNSIDIISIITLAGTASENNSGSVISNADTKEKLCVYSLSAIPTIAIEDPTYTYTVSKWQTASGIFDCFSHLMEQYFCGTEFEWTKNYIFANIKTLIKYAKVVVNEPKNYEARANILWTTTMALNGIASFNKPETDWTVHTIEHALSGLWDVTHGAGLAFVTPTYLKIKSQEDEVFKKQLIELGKACFDTNTAEQTITFIETFIKSINLPTKWTDFDEIKAINQSDIDFLVSHAVKYNFSNSSEQLIRQVVEQLATLK